MYHPTPGPEGQFARLKRCDETLESLTLFNPVAKQALHPPNQDSKSPSQPFAILYVNFDQVQLTQSSSCQSLDTPSISRDRDRILQNLTQALRSRLRDQDMISQVSATQFVIALRSNPIEKVPQIASRLANFLQEPIRIENHQYHVSCKIGVSFYPTDGLETQELIQKANAAVNRAQENSDSHKIKLYPSDTSQAIHRRLLIEQALQHPDLSQQLEIRYQPQWDHLSDRVYGLESLVRWHHPTMGDISPNEFIPIAEELGCIHRITHLAIAESLRFTREILEQHNVILTPSVNVSAQEFTEFQRLYDTIDRELRRSQLPGSLLTVELTERVFLNPSEKIKRQMQQLRDRGVQLTLDDFGTGFSCLQYLLDLPLNTLKIDRAFVQNINQDTRRHGVVQAIVTMAQSLNMKCITEGVETFSELQCLQALGCHVTQGHIIAPALAKSAFIKFLTRSLSVSA